MVGSLFGVVAARFCWAIDLNRAIEIDSIRSKTETYLRETIKSNEMTIEAQRRIIEIGVKP